MFWLSRRADRLASHQAWCVDRDGTETRHAVRGSTCMSHKTAKIGITSLVPALAIGGLLWSTLSEGTEYYKHVDEVMTQPDQWYGKKLRLHGFVVKDSITKR